MSDLGIKGLVDEDFVNYKVPSMFVAFPHCSFKCGREFCQNAALADAPFIDITIAELIERYQANPITEALVIGGMEPFDDFMMLFDLCFDFRESCGDPIVIYSGYDKKEIRDEILSLRDLGNIIVKFGRYIPGQKPHFDETLGIMLASDNQYAKKIC